MTTPEELDALQAELATIIADVEDEMASHASEHSDGSERPDLWDYMAAVSIDGLKTTNAAITALRARVAELEARADAAEAELARTRMALADTEALEEQHGAVIERLQAELARRGQVQVKPLWWPEFHDGGTCGRPPLFQYFVTKDHKGRFWAHFDTSQHDTLEAAQHHCERDYQRAALVSPGDGWRNDPAKAFDKADWFWRTMDPDDCGDSPEEAINRAMVGHFCVCEIASSYSGPTRYGFIAPVLDPDSDDEEFVHFATQDEAIAAAKARSAPPASEGADHG